MEHNVEKRDRTATNIFLEVECSYPNFSETHAQQSENDTKQKEETCTLSTFTERQFRKSDRGENEMTTSYLYD